MKRRNNNERGGVLLAHPPLFWIAKPCHPEGRRGSLRKEDKEKQCITLDYDMFYY